LDYDEFFPDESSNECSANGINNAGQIVGYSETARLLSYTAQDGTIVNYLANGPQHACKWLPGAYTAPQDLGSLIGADGNSEAHGINNNGQIVGYSDANSGTPGSPVSHACLWSDGNPTDLDTNPSGDSIALSINDAGQIAGGYTVNGFLHACIWSPVRGNTGITWVLQDLDPNGEFGYSFALSINNSGQVVGYSLQNLFNNNLTNFRPFIWSPTTQRMKDLNKVIDPASGWKLYYPSCISDTGYITGIGIANNQAHAFLLRPVLWGARVNLTGTSNGKLAGRTVKDHLVSLQGGNVTLLSGLSFDANSNVVTDSDSQIPVTDIASLQVFNDQFDPANPDSGPSEQGFNKYIVQVPEEGDFIAYSETVQLDNNPYDGSIWHYKINSLNSDDQFEDEHATANLTLTAIPRVSGQNGALSRRTNISVDNPIRNIFTRVATQYQIPPQILYAVGWHESAEGSGFRYSGLGWNQFGFTTVFKTLQHPTYQDDPVGYERTLVTYDGGIGIMQITAGTAVGGYTGDGLLNHIYNLASDIGSNVKTGAAILSQKYPLKKIGDNTKNVLEHWYAALWAYNGKIKQSSDRIYPNAIWTAIGKLGGGRWSSANTIPLSTYFVMAGSEKKTGKQLYYPQSGPTLGIGNNTKIAHADVNNDGIVDAVVSSPTAVRSGDGVDISVTITFTAAQKGRVIVSASLDNLTGDMAMVAKPSSRVYSVHVPGNFVQPTTVHFSLNFDQGMVTGVTYQFGL